MPREPGIRHGIRPTTQQGGRGYKRSKKIPPRGLSSPVSFGKAPDAACLHTVVSPSDALFVSLPRPDIYLPAAGVLGFTHLRNSVRVHKTGSHNSGVLKQKSKQGNSQNTPREIARPSGNRVSAPPPPTAAAAAAASLPPTAQERLGILHEAVHEEHGGLFSVLGSVSGLLRSKSR